MCGIVALFAHGGGRIDRDELVRIRDRMAARGPDGAGEWFAPDDRVGLGHRRLAIIDPRAIADQPMVSADGRLALVFNGEIYNYRALKAEFEREGAVFRTNSDTEVLLHLYARDGERMTERLRGMYALALWDATRQGMLLARDPLGIKPLYMAEDGRVLRVASQVKALLAGGAIASGGDPAGEVGFFLWGHVPEPFTLHRAIEALPAGTTRWIDRDGARAPRPFFDFARTLNAPKQRVEAGERRRVVRETLADSVRHHMIADVPVGVFLSAGLDSSVVAALAGEDKAATLRTLTLGFREFAGTENDETVLAEATAKALGASHQTRVVRGEDFAAERAALIEAMDQPSIDGVNTYFVAKAAKASGLKVALSGLGGDEIFGGYPSFRQIPRLVAALSPFAALRPLGRLARAGAAPWLGRITSPKYAGLLEYGGDYPGAYLLRRALFMPWELASFMARDRLAAGLDRLATRSQLARSIEGLDDPRRIVSALEMNWYMRGQLLRDADWAGMAHSLEIRVPFVDVEVLRRLAPLMHGAEPPSKQDMAASPARKLPEAVLHRAKTGFVVPVREWLMGERAREGGAAERGLRGWARRVHDLQGA